MQIASNWTGGSETCTAAVSDHSQALHSNRSLTVMGCLAKVLRWRQSACWHLHACHNKFSTAW